MSVVVVGLQHRRTSLDVLERATVGQSAAPKVWALLRNSTNLEEAVLLSTCLRTEVYAVVDRFHDAVSEVQEIIAQRVGLDVVGLGEQWDIRFDDDVVVHLFNVASGTESAVLGETEVLGQVRRAWQHAQEERVCGPVLSELFRHAVRTGKRVRAETAISRGTTSFANAAVQLAQKTRSNGLAGSRVVVVGAGAMGAGVVSALSHISPADRPSEVAVVSRRPARAQAAVERIRADLAARDVVDGLLPDDGPDSSRDPQNPQILPLRVAELQDLPSLLAEADVLVTAVDAPEPVLTPDHLGNGRAAHALLAIDMGVPRNISSAARQLEGIRVLDIQDLRAAVDRAIEERHQELIDAQHIIGEEIHRYRESRRARGAAPVVAALRDRLENLRQGELDRRRAQLGDLSEEDWAKVEEVTRGVLGKLVHEPTMMLKESSGTPRGERLVEALRQLFDL